MRRSLKLRSRLVYSVAYALFFTVFNIAGFVGDVVPGTSLWCIEKRIANTTDIIESQLDILLSDTFVLSPCQATPVTAANIVAGVITLTASGNYCLAQDVTADIVINGDCISFDLNNRCVTGTITISSDDVELFSGNVKPASPTTAPAAATPALTIASSAARVTVSTLVIENADSGGTGINGRNGAEIDGDDIIFRNSTVLAGSASPGTTGGAGGAGITIGTTANNVIINNILIASGNGGNSTANAVAGGNAGDGIDVLGAATETEVNNCTILSTGHGGNGTGTGNPNGGNGGNGIFIASTAIDTVVRGCTIRNTGTGGLPNGTGTNGIDGKAALDLVVIVANLSFFYQNFAHNIANSIKFDLQGTGLEQGVAIANPPTATVVNPYANVFIS